MEKAFVMAVRDSRCRGHMLSYPISRLASLTQTNLAHAIVLTMFDHFLSLCFFQGAGVVYVCNLSELQ